MSTPTEPQMPGGFLGWIEKAGNKVPNPAVLFLSLILGVIAVAGA